MEKTGGGAVDCGVGEGTALPSSSGVEDSCSFVKRVGVVSVFPPRFLGLRCNVEALPRLRRNRSGERLGVGIRSGVDIVSSLLSVVGESVLRLLSPLLVEVLFP